MITININKAKEIAKTKLRQEREPLLASLDVQYMRAIEQGADTKDILAKKQKLRDITNLVEQATSIDELKSIKI